MNKAKEILNELQNLDMDIQSRIDEINELEEGLLPSGQQTRLKAVKPKRLMMSILSLL